MADEELNLDQQGPPQSISGAPWYGNSGLIAKQRYGLPLGNPFYGGMSPGFNMQLGQQLQQAGQAPDVQMAQAAMQQTQLDTQGQARGGSVGLNWPRTLVQESMYRQSGGSVVGTFAGGGRAMVGGDEPGGIRLPDDVMHKLVRTYGGLHVGYNLAKLFDVDPNDPALIPHRALHFWGRGDVGQGRAKVRAIIDHWRRQ
jgi:hypothetical protein